MKKRAPYVRNSYETDGEITRISLPRKFEDKIYVATIDTEDLPIVQAHEYSWGVKIYKERVQRVADINQMLMATLILNSGNYFISYRNNDPLDLRKSNLIARPRGLVYTIDEPSSTAVFTITHSTGEVYNTIVDIDDLDRVVSSYRQLTTLEQIGDIPRAYGRLYGSKDWVYLHRFIIDAPKEYLVDHINCNPLDNRKENLRLVKMGENMQNRRGATKRSKTGIRGVHFDTRKGLYVAQVQVDKVSVFREYFTDIKEAEEAVIAARAKYMPCSKDARDVLEDEAA